MERPERSTGISVEGGKRWWRVGLEADELTVSHIQVDQSHLSTTIAASW